MKIMWRFCTSLDIHKPYTTGKNLKIVVDYIMQFGIIYLAKATEQKGFNMKTQEQILVAAQKKNIAIHIEKIDDIYFDEPWFEILMTSACSGYGSSTCFRLDHKGNVYVPWGWAGATMRNFAERLFYRCSDLHACDWSF